MYIAQTIELIITRVQNQDLSCVSMSVCLQDRKKSSEKKKGSSFDWPNMNNSLK